MVGAEPLVTFNHEFDPLEVFPSLASLVFRIHERSAKGVILSSGPRLLGEASLTLNSGHVLGNARIQNVGKYQSCMVSK